MIRTLRGTVRTLRLIVGLGNPGKRYQDTRHNIGFKVLDCLADSYNISCNKRKFNALYGRGRIAEKDILVLKPQTYMNLSGLSVMGFKNFFRLSPDDIIVVYDDMDLPFGRLRIRPAGGAGGHKGIISVVDTLGRDDFSRVRMGIGRPENTDPAGYVLSPFNKSERDCLMDFIRLGKEAIETVIDSGIEDAMNRFNGLNGNLDMV